jgi:hypothetical protein
MIGFAGQRGINGLNTVPHPGRHAELPGQAAHAIHFNNLIILQIKDISI